MFDEEILLDSDGNLIESTEPETVLIEYDSEDPKQNKSYLNLLLDFFNERYPDEEINMYHEAKNVFLLMYDGVYKGFVVYKPVSGDTAYIRILGVSSKYRGIGLGKTLVSSFVDIIKGSRNFNKIQLGVNEDNLVAISVYSKLGFKTILKASDEGRKFRKMELKI